MSRPACWPDEDGIARGQAVSSGGGALVATRWGVAQSDGGAKASARV